MFTPKPCRINTYKNAVGGDSKQLTPNLSRLESALTKNREGEGR
jgi:hypothetical protein